MCGYFIAIDSSGKSLAYKDKELNLASSFIKQRGKDFFAYEYYKNKSIVAGHARLEIQGVGESGKQPLVSNDGNHLLLFNGEIYNHLQLRKKYFSDSKRWKSYSDAETLINLIEKIGFLEAINTLTGMFSIVLYDFQNKRIYSAIDKFGEKPLYYHCHGTHIILANNLDALRALSKNKFMINNASLKTYFEIGYIPAPSTIFSEVKKLCPGECLFINYKDCKNSLELEISNYYDVGQTYNETSNSDKPIVKERSLIEELDKKLDSVIMQATISEVPYCATLSGGIDSGLLNYYLAKNVVGLDSYHLYCEDFGHNELSRASLISKNIKSNLRVVEITKNDLQDSLANIANAYDEPFADSSQIPTLILSKEIAKDYKVCLTGDGLDEMFSGYNRHVFLPKLANILSMVPKSKELACLVKKIINTEWGSKKLQIFELFLPSSGSQIIYNEKIYKLFDLISRSSTMNLQDLYEATLKDGKNILKEPASEKFKPDFLQDIKKERFSGDIALCFADIKTYLPNDILVKVDRASMYYSLEMRAPYLNTEILKFGINLPSNQRVFKGKGKYLLRKLFINLIGGEGGFDAKTGFSIPIGKYINEVYSYRIIEFLKIQPFDYLIDYDKLIEIWSNHISGNFRDTQTIWRYLCFVLWAEQRGYK